jgi:hypothetical protein
MEWGKGYFHRSCPDAGPFHLHGAEQARTSMDSLYSRRCGEVIAYRYRDLVELFLASRRSSPSFPPTEMTSRFAPSIIVLNRGLT